jgi:hypothetical protein
MSKTVCNASLQQHNRKAFSGDATAGAATKKAASLISSKQSSTQTAQAAFSG